MQTLEDSSSSGSKSGSFKELLAWPRSMAFVVDVYAETESWPQTERYGLTQQMRRSCVSVPSNIAEGQGRRDGREFSHFMRIARGSLQEAETQIMIGARLGFCSNEKEGDLLEQAGHIGRMILGLRRAIASRAQPITPPESL